MITSFDLPGDGAIAVEGRAIKAAGVFGRKASDALKQRRAMPLPTIEKFEADFCAYLRVLACNDDPPPAV